MKTVTLIISCTGKPLRAFLSQDQARNEFDKMTLELRPWEKSAGYWYGMKEIEIEETPNG